MALKIYDRFSGANVRILSIRTSGPSPEITFSPDPKGGTEALWFDFRLHDQNATTESAPETLAVTMLFFETLLGGSDPSMIRPVLLEDGKNWVRLKPPKVKTDPDGQTKLSWTIPYPVNITEFAFCLPYGSDELAVALKHCRGYWQETGIGLTQDGRVLNRLSNNILKGCDACANPRGLYVAARQHAGETPGSWVMDGMLDTFSRAKPVNWCIWIVPFANPDDVVRGACGKDPFPYDLNRAWGKPPMRHEALVLQHDICRWAQRCNPELVLDLHAAGASENDGVYVYAKKSDAAEREKNTQTWMNIFKQALSPEYSAEDFAKTASPSSRWNTPRLTDFVETTIGCSTMSLKTPYALVGSTVLLQKHYREIGQRLAHAILTRWRKA